MLILLNVELAKPTMQVFKQKKCSKPISQSLSLMAWVFGGASELAPMEKEKAYPLLFLAVNMLTYP